MIFTFIKRIKGVKSKFQDFGHSFGNMKSSLETLKNYPESLMGKDKKLAEEHKEGIEQFMNLLDKKSK